MRTASPRPGAIVGGTSVTMSPRMRSASGSVSGVSGSPSRPKQLLERGVHVAAADHRLGVRLERLGRELALDEPLHRAVRVVLKRATGDDVAMADVRERRSAERLHDALGRDRRGTGRGVRPRLAPATSARCPATTYVGEQALAAALGPVRDEQIGDVGDERRWQREVPVLIRAAVAERDPLGRPRDRGVEQVALPGERVLGGRQPQAARERDLVAVLVGEERLARARAAGTHPRCSPHTNTTRNRRARTASGSASCTAPARGGSPVGTSSSSSSASSSTPEGRSPSSASSSSAPRSAASAAASRRPGASSSAARPR